MTASITNIITNFAFAKVNTLMKSGFVTPEILDQWEGDVQKLIIAEGQTMGKARIRESLVQYILNEFDVVAFGLPLPRENKEVSDKAIKRMNSQRKKGFVDLKIIKGAK
ncbi:hypothetical protein SP18gp067 [Shigella phage SP18]|uniref:Uncharacterized protein gp55.2 n=1 Tax=Shigella phage SP18 TaxID=645664 RepID=E3SFF6_BPSP8|nr:hypothetical protein SP18_gp067 [Shigella phage SP18]ADO19409.1 hypothetical protein SP18gp067 [Shigella phage SP18]